MYDQNEGLGAAMAEGIARDATRKNAEDIRLLREHVDALIKVVVAQQNMIAALSRKPETAALEKAAAMVVERAARLKVSAVDAARTAEEIREAARGL